MAVLEKPRFEKFAQARFRGFNIQRAYVLAGYKPDRKGASILNRRPEVKARIAELNADAARAATYEKVDAIRDIIAIIRARPTDGGPDNHLCNRHMSSRGEYFTFPDKLRAIERLARMLNWDTVESPISDNPDSLSACIARIREGK